MSQLSDPRMDFIDDVNIADLKVAYTPEPVILLCGGLVPPPKNNPDDPEPPLKSLRQLVNTEAISFFCDPSVQKFTLFRPEEIVNWSNDALFKNLMVFEEELAAISSLVVVILESAGAIAELGAFSQLPQLSKKLIVFKSLEYGNDNSFIDLGILRYLISDHGENRVKKYSWTPPELNRGIPLIETATANNVLHDISDEIKKLKKTSKFKKDLDTHITALVCELLDIFSALKENEILLYINTLEIDISKDRLKRKLFILEWFSIIKKEHVSDATFYYRSDDAFHTINGFHIKNKPIDKLRLKSDTFEFYKEKKERHRLQAIKNIGHSYDS